MNDVTKIENNDFMSKYQKTENIVEDVRNIIEASQKEAYRAVNTILSQRNWLIGYRIAEEELAGEGRAEYGVEIIKRLSRELTDKYGKGYDRSNLYHCLRFYKAFPGIVDTVCRQSNIRLSWSHYRTLLQVHDQDVGQMDMYIRMYDELKKSADDNPTLGIVLCSQTDEDIARYSILHGNEQLFASKYKLYLPTEEELREEIETQKAMFYLQQKEAEEGEKN